MGKVEAQRAMRDARYAAYEARREAAAAAPRPTSTPTSKPTSTPATVASEPLPVVVTQEDEAVVPEALCGHRSMNNKSCMRPAGHPEKSHRYS